MDWECFDDDIQNAPTCPYCKQKAVLQSSEVVYGKGRNFGNIWVCKNYPSCDSYVGCHKGGSIPLGTLANAELRELRKQAHALFDPLWKENKINLVDRSFVPGQSLRQKSYKWLAEQLFISREDCHFSWMDKPTIKKAIRILKTAY